MWRVWSAAPSPLRRRAVYGIGVDNEFVSRLLVQDYVLTGWTQRQFLDTCLGALKVFRCFKPAHAAFGLCLENIEWIDHELPPVRSCALKVSLPMLPRGSFSGFGRCFPRICSSTIFLTISSSGTCSKSVFRLGH